MDNTNFDYIVDTNSYTLAIHPQKNRVYCMLKTNAVPAPDLSEIYDVWAEVESRLSSEFTMLLDAGIEKFQHPATIGFLLSVQQIAAGKGVHKVAEVLSGSDFALLLHRQIAEMAGTETRRKVFAEREGAERWLDSSGV